MESVTVQSEASTVLKFRDGREVPVVVEEGYD